MNAERIEHIWTVYGRDAIVAELLHALESAQNALGGCRQAREAAIRECAAVCRLIADHDPTGIMSEPADFERACLELLGLPAPASLSSSHDCPPEDVSCRGCSDRTYDGMCDRSTPTCHRCPVCHPALGQLQEVAP